MSGIAEATFARSLSSHREQRADDRVASPAPPAFTVDDADVRRAGALALYASKIVALFAGLRRDHAGAAQYGWTDRPRRDRKIWRAGCIIRAHRSSTASRMPTRPHPDLAVLLTAPYFVDALGRAQTPGAAIVGTAATASIPAPAFSSSLAYYDGPARSACPPRSFPLRATSSARTPYQHQLNSTFHTLWSGDRTESAEDTH